jgi:hypothetical protein
MSDQFILDSCNPVSMLSKLCKFIDVAKCLKAFEKILRHFFTLSCCVVLYCS